MDPNMFGNMSEMFKNPEMMKSMEEMMKNPDIMSNAMKMMSDPSIMNMFGGMGGSNPETETTEQNTDPASPLEEQENLFDGLDFMVNDEVLISGLKTDTYNNQIGVIRNYNPDTTRYEVFIEELDKSISIKPENITKQNTEENVTEQQSETIEVD